MSLVNRLSAMFNNNNKNEEEDISSEEDIGDISSEGEEMEDNYVKCHTIVNYEGEYIEGVNLKVYSCYIRSCLPFIKQWAYNRMLNNNHIDDIEKSLENKPYVIGTIKLMKSPNDG